MYKFQKTNIQKQSKQYIWLLILGGVMILASLIYLLCLDSVNKKIVTDSIYTYFHNFRKEEYDAFSLFLGSVGSNLLFTIGIWVLGISMIGIPIVFFALYGQNLSFWFQYLLEFYKHSV